MTSIHVTATRASKVSTDKSIRLTPDHAIQVSTANPIGIAIHSSPKEMTREVERIRREIEHSAFHLFESRGCADGQAIDDWLQAEAQLFKPFSVSLQESPERFTLVAQLSGFDAKQIKLTANENSLLLTGESGTTHQDGETHESATERIYQHICLPEQVLLEKATAVLDNGELTIVLPKAHVATHPKSIAA